MSKKKFAVVVFPGSNCDHDVYYAVKYVMGHDAHFVWHKDTNLKGSDAVVLPGGFSYGDYLRSGSIAKFSPIMRSVSEFASAGRPVIGVCNGFQILLEAGLLPGGMRRNQHLKFICEYVTVRVEATDTPFTCNANVGQTLRLPVAHGDGNYYADRETVDELEDNRQIIFRYTTSAGELNDAANVNGSTAAIAGICNKKRNVIGLMPHPERACEMVLGSADGRIILDSVVTSLES